MPPALSHIETWIFDLDLTLYTPDANIMAQVRDRIALFVEGHFQVGPDEANDIRQRYWRKYGTTLSGLMAEHDVEPHGYLDFVHDVDLSKLTPCPDLRAQIEALPGRKLIFTNADLPYAKRVLAARGLDGLFEDVFDIHCMAHLPKPASASYEAFCGKLNVNPVTAAFVEDSAHNLVPAKALGMTTIWVKHAGEADSGGADDHIDFVITDLAQWLAEIRQQEQVT
ncbi:MAG TPA: pyrimidine 5'-nucleotidase [Sphingorhabdus sp.]|jgi:putative hydrolase of the HAD superfamily|nr:pyrimidine 5'-nucleotidase [Sphingorhabdus sp.]